MGCAVLSLRRGASGAAAALAAVCLVSCGGEEQGNLSGTWEGFLSDSTARWPTAMFLEQQGVDVAGTLGGTALVGRVERGSLTFSLTYGGLCAGAATGSATVTPLADRDRIQLSYYGSTSCEGAFGASGWFDRLRCPSGALACSGAYAADLVPYCARAQTDEANCGECGVKCGEFQACASGKCQVPACTGPVRLEAALRYQAAVLPLSLAVGDVNGDGAPDAVVLGHDTWYMGPIPAAVAVLLGDGRGGLGSPIRTELAPAPAAVALGDLDGDGSLDAAVYAGAGGDHPAIAILLGNGDGSFRAGQTFPVAGDGPPRMPPERLIALADLDGDGALDLAARSGAAPAVQVRHGLGDGTFGPAQAYALPAAPGALLASDLDGDGKVDLAAASYAYPERRVSVLLGNGDGTFQPHVDFEGVEAPHDIAVGDFDGNGAPDLVVAGETNDWVLVPYPAVAVLLGNGDGTFAPPVGVAQRSLALGLAVADLDGDGHQDVAAAVGGGFEVALGNGEGTFATGVQFPVPTWDPTSSGGARSIAAADLDGDGAEDLVVANWEHTVSVFLACQP